MTIFACFMIISVFILLNICALNVKRPKGYFQCLELHWKGTRRALLGSEYCKWHHNWTRNTAKFSITAVSCLMILHISEQYDKQKTLSAFSMVHIFNSHIKVNVLKEWPPKFPWSCPNYLFAYSFINKLSCWNIKIIFYFYFRDVNSETESVENSPKVSWFFTQ